MQTGNMRTPYRPPTVDRSKVTNLMPEHSRGAVLLPTTPVVCINRGPKVLEDKYDGYDYVIDPFLLFEVTYAAALHLQKRLLVQGTVSADAQNPSFASYIGILGIDSEEACQPFSAEQLAAIGDPVEALHRDPRDPLQRGFVTIKTRDVVPTGDGHGLATPAQAGAGGGGRFGSLSLQQEVTGGPEVTDEIRELAMAPVEGSEARLEEGTARGSGYEPPRVSELRVRSDERIKFTGDQPPSTAGSGGGDASQAPDAPRIGSQKGKGGGKKR